MLAERCKTRSLCGANHSQVLTRNAHGNVHKRYMIDCRENKGHLRSGVVKNEPLRETATDRLVCPARDAIDIFSRKTKAINGTVSLAGG